MFFPAITLLTSLALAAVAGWFSIAGLVTIMAAEPIAALILGITLELGKLVTASWLYRNWHHANWWLKTPLLYFMAALMMTTSMGVFGYLSKAHLEQGSATVDNSARISEIERRIGKEQLKIADNDKMIAQLDNVVDTLIAKEQTNRALAVRRSQAAQRAQLKESTQQIQAEIEKLSEEKFQLGVEGGGVGEAKDDLELVVSGRRGEDAGAEVAGEVGGELLAFVQPGAEILQAFAWHAACHQHGDRIGRHRVSPERQARPG